MEWPLKNEKTGKPRTTPTNQSIFLAAVQEASGELSTQEVEDWKQRLENCQNWRQDYVELLYDFGKLQAKCSPDTVLAMCRAGLQAATQAFVFRVHDDKVISLEQAFQEDSSSASPLQTEIHHGTQQSSSLTRFSLALPQNGSNKVQWVTGDDAVAQLNAWKTYGCMEPSAAEHAQAVCQSSDLSSLVSDKTFCLLGITSEMGPLHHLMKIPGAHVMGVARGGSKLNQLVQKWQQEGAVDTTLQIPQGGANLLEQTPQIARWIVETAPKDRSLVIMPLAYMDGEANVRVTVAMDAIVEHVRKYRSDKVSLVYLTSPSTVYAIPPSAAQDAKERYEQEGLRNLIRMATFGKWLQPSNTWKQQETESNSLIVLNGLASLQGPNYALAKMMQQWRCMVAHAEGLTVAAPHAPPTRTYSVQHNAQAAAGLEGLQYFPPMVSFDVEACSSLMTAIVLDQVNRPPKACEHPMQLFWDGSVHGGSWRCPYTTESCLVPAYLLGRTIATPGSCPEAAMARIESQPTPEDAV